MEIEPYIVLVKGITCECKHVNHIEYMGVPLSTCLNRRWGGSEQSEALEVLVAYNRNIKNHARDLWAWDISCIRKATTKNTLRKFPIDWNKKELANLQLLQDVQAHICNRLREGVQDGDVVCALSV